VETGSYDVFVSYSRADASFAADVDTVLRQHGLRTFFDRRDLPPGFPWVPALEKAIGAAKAAIILLGPSGFGNTQQYERQLAFERQTREPTFPVVPVLLPNTRDPPFNFLRIATWVDFSRAAKVWDAPEELQRLVTAVRTRLEGPETKHLEICPYRGLDAFREEDSALFFGRGSAADPASPIGQLVRKVRDYDFVMVVGRSGSGKSSLVYAGLVPALRRETNRYWNVLSLRPGSEPLRALAAAFNPRTESEGAAVYADKIGREAEKLREGEPDLLSHMIREDLNRAEEKPDRLLLYIDQWEELYVQGPSHDARQRDRHAGDVSRFIDLLLNATRSTPVTVVATVRADFYDPLISHPEIRGLLKNQQVLIASMTRSELKTTIVEPARMVGLSCDPPTLVDRILDEAGADEGMLPLLQYALKETWNRREGNRLTADSYTRSGGVREAIRITAERTFDALSPEEQQAARQLFLRLVTPGEGQEDTRARAAMPTETVQIRIIEQFASSRTRLLVTGFDRAKRPVVEVAHEALIRTWPRLREWIDANRDKLRARTAILHAKAEWEQNDRSEDLLLPKGFKLVRARALLAQPGDIAINDIEDFVAASTAHEQAQIARREEAERRLKEAELEAARRAREIAEKELELAAERAATAEADRTTKEQQLRYQRRRAYRVVFFSVLFSVGAVSIAIFALAQLLRGNAEQEFATFNFNRFRFVQAIHDAGAVYDSLARPLLVYFERLRDVDRAETLLAKETTKREVTNERKSFDAAQELLIHAEAEQQRWLDQLNQYNEHLWKALFESEREKIFASAPRILTSAPDPESRLRLAMYAVAAIPEEREDLNGILRKAISDSPQVALKLPGATQTWGVAYDLRDNHRAAVGDEGGVAWLWDPVTYLSVPDPNIKLWARSAAGGLINGLAFNEDGSLLAAAYRSSGVVVWGLSGEPKVVCKLRPMGEGIGAYGVAFHGSLLAIAGGDHAVHIWDVSKNQCPETEKSFSRGDMVLGVAISGDGKMLAAASADGSVVVWNIDNPEIKILEERFGKPMFAVAFSRDAKLLAATGADGLSYFWDIRDGSDGIEIKRRNTDDLSSTGELSSNVQGSKRGTLGQISFSPDEKKVVATALADGTVVVTDVSTLQKNNSLWTGKQSLFGVAFSPDSKYLLISSEVSGYVSVFSMGAATPITIMDRDELLQMGFRRLINTSLTEPECEKLASLGIPIFDKSFRQKDKSVPQIACPLPLLAFQKIRFDIQF
jgi:WD40 repeat protein